MAKHFTMFDCYCFNLEPCEPKPNGGGGYIRMQICVDCGEKYTVDDSEFIRGVV